MTWFNKYGWIVILVILAVSGLLFYLWWKKNNQQIAFDFSVGGDVQSLVNDLSARYATNTKGIGIYLNVPLTTLISNKSAIASTLSNIIGSITYNGESILQTNANSPALTNVNVAAKSSVPVTDNVQVLVNPSSIKFFSELVQGNKPIVNYNFGATIAGKPYNFSNTTQVNKSTI